MSYYTWDSVRLPLIWRHGIGLFDLTPSFTECVHATRLEF